MELEDKTKELTDAETFTSHQVTDSRDLPPTRHRPAVAASMLPSASSLNRSRGVTVDNVLGYSSDIPSMQRRGPPAAGLQGLGLRNRTGRLGVSGGGGGVGGGSGRAVALGKGGAGASVAGSGGGAAGVLGVPRLATRGPNLPPRSTKVSEKLVLLPDTIEDDDADRIATEGLDFMEDNEAAPLPGEEQLLGRRRVRPEKAKSYAERLPKARRRERLPRVTAYCTAQAYKLPSAASFVREIHGARTKLYDDCLYVAYHLPLLPGRDGYRVRSSPAVRSARGKTVLDEEIERNEQRDYHEDYAAEEQDEHSVAGDESEDNRGRTTGSELSGAGEQNETTPQSSTQPSETPSHSLSPPAPAAQIPSNVFAFAEMFVYSYGVVVLWNFTEHQERDVLGDIAFFSFAHRAGSAMPLSLAVNPLRESDFETEEFHFEYSTEISRPRVYNDMITLRSGDHMIKLAISHGVAQSTKLSLFEEVMARQMADAKDIPRRLALTGALGMRRDEVLRILGRLFKSRVDVNLSSNVLDVPNFFWDSEPTLHPLYSALREYLEIKPRIQVLNERCRVFLDLTEILSDSITDSQVDRQTWIVIVLIVISIFVSVTEVVLRFAILNSMHR